MSGFLSVLGTVFNWILYLALAAAFYYAWSMPLHRIATGRGLRFPWLAWIPVVSLFVLFAIADDIFRKRRKPARLLGLGVIVAGIWVVLVALTLSSAVHFALSLLGYVPALAMLVILHIALYRFYTEYKWRSSVALTVLGIFTPIAIPIFLFVCRGERPRAHW